jgi:hypothetical protein
MKRNWGAAALALVLAVEISFAFFTLAVAQNPGVMIVGGTPIVNGVNADCFYDNNGILGNQACGSGSGVTSITGGCQAGASPSTGAVTISTEWILSASSPVSTTSYTLLAADACDNVLLQSGNTGVIVPNPTTSGFGNGQSWAIDNATGGSVALTTTASGGYTGIDGGVSFTIPNGTTVSFHSDGTNYHWLIAPQTAPSSTIVAGTTPTSGFSANDLFASVSSAVGDTGIPYTNLALLTGTQTIAGAKTFSTAPIFSSINGSTQCLQVNTAGQVAGSGAGCGSGGSVANYPVSNYVSGRWYFPIPAFGPATGSAVSANRLYCVFGGVTASVTIKAIGLNITTGSSGGTLNTISIGLFSVGATTMSFIDATATMSSTGIAEVSGALQNTTDTLSPGVLYAFCANTDATPVYTAQSTGAGAPASELSIMGGASLNVAAGNFTGKLINGTYAGIVWTAFSSITISAMSDTTNVPPIVEFQVN